MKTRTVRRVVSVASNTRALAGVGLMLLAAAPGLAGPLDPPPGPITSTGKVLADIEPRTAINASNTPGDSTCVFKITRPGSYCFTGNILGAAGKSGILIALGPSGGHVSIDMRGFTLQGVPESLDGITDRGPGWSPNQTCDIGSTSGTGGIRDWGGIGLVLHSSANVSNIQGITWQPCYIVAGSTHTATLRNCRLHSRGGAALVTDPNVPIVIDNTIIEGEGCDTTSLVSLGGPTTMGFIPVIAVSHSVFSGPIIDITPTGYVSYTGGGGGGYTMRAVSVTAGSAIRVNAGSGPAFVEDRTFDDEFISCTFTNAIIETYRDGTRLRGLNVHADAATTAPVGLRVNASNCAIDDGLWWLHTSVIPVAVSITGSSNSIQNLCVNEAGTGVRIAGASNTISGCRFSGTGAVSSIGVLIAAGSTGNIVKSCEFVNFTSAGAVSNLGGSSNGVAPILTSASLGAATSPFANLQH